MSSPSPAADDATSGAAPDGERVGLERLITRNFLTLGGGEMLARLIGFVVTIFIARRLGVQGYGIIGFGFALMLYAAALVDLGMEHLGPREVARRDAPLDTLVGSLLLTRFVVSLLLAAGLAVVGVLASTQPEGRVIALFALTLLAAGLNARWVHIGFDRTRTVAAARLAAEVTKAAIVLTFVRGPDDILRVPVAFVLGDAITALWLLIRLRDHGVRRLRADRAVASAVFRRASPLLVTNLLALLIYNADIVMLRAFQDRAEVGLYLAAYALINFVGVLGNITTLSLLPTLSRLRATPEVGRHLYETSLARVFAVGIPIAAGVTLLAPRILDLVFGDAYARSAVALAILIWSIPPLLLRSVAQAALVAAGREKRVLHSTAWAAVVNVSLNLVAIPLLVMVGAAITTVAAEVVRLALAHHWARGAGFRLAAPARFGRAAAAAAGMVGVLVLLRTDSALLAVPLGAAAYGVFLTIFGGIRFHEGSLAIRV